MYQLTTPEGNSVKVKNKDIVWNALYLLEKQCARNDFVSIVTGSPTKTIVVSANSLVTALEDLRPRFL